MLKHQITITRKFTSKRNQGSKFSRYIHKPALYKYVLLLLLNMRLLQNLIFTSKDDSKYELETRLQYSAAVLKSEPIRHVSHDVCYYVI